MKRTLHRPSNQLQDRTGTDDRLTPGHRAQTLRMHMSNTVDTLLLMMAPLVLASTALGKMSHTAVLSAFVALVTVAIFFMRFERSRPYLHELMPIVALVGVALAGRLLFIALPSFKPMLAITIIAGICLSKQSGFMVGALAMLVSNMIFGQGPWTPWQMYAMGLAGYLSGVIFSRGMPSSWRGLTAVVLWGVVAALAYGIILDTYHVVWFVQPLKATPVLAAYLSGLPFSLVHAGATAVFLTALARPWSQHLSRIAIKYGLENLDQPYDNR